MDNIIKFVDGLMAASTPAAPAWNVEHTLGGKAPAWNYIDGCMIKAILDLHSATGEQKYFDFAKNYVDFYVSPDGSLLGYRVEDHNCDQINMGKSLFPLYKTTGEEKYKKALDLQYSQLLVQPRIRSGNFWHKQIYENQVWLDGLYMVQPFYMEYEMMFFGGKKNAKDIFGQFTAVYDTMRDEHTGLYYHGYDDMRQMFWADKKTGLSKNFWTRSIGWYSMALVDTIDAIGSHFPYERGTLGGDLKELLDALLAVADKDTKMFYQVTNAGGKPGNYLETSGTCAIAYSLMKGARLEALPPVYYDYGKEIFDSV
ncbi:MAG: glycoside hydrolase family 88 protein, partial [Oscillospiraceae bacterium]|nr:glycoside hydrolase family 88 protein [Oscillospiraceae bacterium]